jgi:CheY-like chemotaxis protein
MITSEQFLQDLRSGLNHLYDPYFLQKSPLAHLFDLGNQPDTPAALQRILLEAIYAMEPKAGDPNLSQRSRTYDLMMYRYVQQFEQEEVANQLGVSVRHLRREQNAAIFELGAYLWEHYRLGARPLEKVTLEVEESVEPAAPQPIPNLARKANAENVPAGAGPAPATGDLEWLRHTPLEEPADLGAVLETVMNLSWSLAERRHVQFEWNPEEHLTANQSILLAVQPIALRQMLLTLLTVAIPREEGGVLMIDMIPRQADVLIRIVGGSQRPGRGSFPFSVDENATLQITQRMAAISGGQLLTSAGPETSFRAELILPAYRPCRVLVIDDNADFIQMIERFVIAAAEQSAGLVCQVTGERNPDNAIDAAIKCQPDIILLDVMMPRLDGWEVLGRLRRHPNTIQIPIIVCTILAQEELAFSLGAHGFLRKPVTPDRILAVLEQHCRLRPNRGSKPR